MTAAADAQATAGEVQTVVAARRLTNTRTVFIGVGRPSTAAILARMVHNPDLVLVYESGTIGAKPFHIPLSIGDGELAETADVVVSVPEMFNYWIGPGRIDVAFLGAAQVDRYANLNSTVIGDYQHPKTRLPGAGGAPEIASSCGEVIVIAPHSRRTFVPKLDFITTVGHGDGPGARERLGFRGAGPTAVITDLGVLEPDPETKELVLVQVHQGVEAGQVQEQTGWDLKVADHVRRTEPPTAGGARRAARAGQPMSSAYVIDAVRTPFGRYARRTVRRAPRRSRRPCRQGARRPPAGDRSGPDRRRHLRRRQPGRGGQPQCGPDGRAPGRTAHRRARGHREPPLRFEPGRGDAGQPLDRNRRRVHRPRRRGRVDEPRPVGPAEARAWLSASGRGASLDHARVAHGQPRDARAVDDRARSQRRKAGRHVRHLPRGTGPLRPAQPPAGHRGLGRRLLRQMGGPGARDRARARREHPRRYLAREAGENSSRPSSRTARSRRATPPRSTTAPALC